MLQTEFSQTFDVYPDSIVYRYGFESITHKQRNEFLLTERFQFSSISIRMAFENPIRGTVESVYTLPDYRMKGYANTLLPWAIKTFFETNKSIESIQLTVGKFGVQSSSISNETIQKFYGKFGFKDSVTRKYLMELTRDDFEENFHRTKKKTSTP